MIRTRWFVLVTVLIVSAIGLLVRSDELARSEDALGDLGADQVEVARAASLVLSPTTTPEQARAALATLERPGVTSASWSPPEASGAKTMVVMLAPPGEPLVTLAGQPAPAEIAPALAHDDEVVRLPPASSASLGLPERTAMVGIARTGKWTIAIASSAEHQRDRDKEGRRRMLMSIVLATGVLSAFAAIVWLKQRSEAKLSRELAVAETEHARDAELERLSRAATMAALGSGVAHELSTPLGVIVGRAEQLVARASDERTTKAAQAIIEQADYIDRVVRGLLGLARGAPIALEDIATEAVVADTFELVRHRFERKGVELVPTVGERVPAVHCEPLLLKHALVNLLLNACDAAPVGSTVELEVKTVDTSIVFTVTDEGDGIAPDVAERVLEPFFTTKPTGTGLGLAIASEIAKSHRGTLELAARTPRGTRAAITLPREPSS